MIVTTTATSKAIVSDWVYPPDGRRSCNGPPSRRPRRYLGRGRNRRNSNQPMRPAVSNATPRVARMKAATADATVQFRTLLIERSPSAPPHSARSLSIELLPLTETGAECRRAGLIPRLRFQHDGEGGQEYLGLC